MKVSTHKEGSEEASSTPSMRSTVVTTGNHLSREVTPKGRTWTMFFAARRATHAVCTP